MKKLKNIIARMKLRMMCNKYQAGEFDLPEDMRRIFRLLVCLPPGMRELAMIKQLLPDISRVFARAEIYLMASPGYNVYDIFPRKGFRIMSPSSGDITWTGLITRKYLSVLDEKKFDAILDLNLYPNYFVQSVLLAFPDVIKIGNGNSIGPPFYNLEVKTRFIRDEKNIYKSMLETIDSLKNYGSNRVNGTIN